MGPRQRFQQIVRFERPNDPFMWGVYAWNDTLRRWVREGMPGQPTARNAHAHLLGFQDEIESIVPNAAVVGLGENGNPPWSPPLVPFFELKIFEDDGTHITRQDYDGAVVRVMKDDPEAMSQWLDYPVKNHQDWEDYKKRLDPHSQERFPVGWDVISDATINFPMRKELEGKRFSERDFPLGMTCLSLFGGPRDYMGLENYSYAMYENLALIEEMIDWQTYFACEMLQKVFRAGMTLDFAWIWEDIAYKGGSLVSPRFIRKHMLPRYRKVVDVLRSNGVELLILDSDGDIHELIPLWLEAGINAVYPLEVASGMDGIALRKIYGKDLVMVGNVDKRSLAAGKSEIDAELAKVRALLAYGGYFPSCDHHIPPDVPYQNIVYFINELRKMSAYPETRRTIEISCED